MGTREGSATPRIADALQVLRRRLFAELGPEGFWEGMLSSSALSTATAVSAMSLGADAGVPLLRRSSAENNATPSTACKQTVAHGTVDPASRDDSARIGRGVAWLCRHHNADGGWGDTIDSPSNLATSLLAMSALRLAKTAGIVAPLADRALQRAEEYVGPSKEIVPAIQHAYGADRTFAVPILMNCALAGLVAWKDVPGLPFEMAVFPHRWYKVLRLHVVSYALPALIAIGLAVHHHHPPRSRLLRAIRRTVTKGVLQKLGEIQPEHGGFLDAAPLTSFVAMGLVPLFGREQPVTARCLSFLRNRQRPDGSWPIDTNLATWVTTSAVTALAATGDWTSPASDLPPFDCEKTARWIAARQGTVPHPFTQAAAGGWAWTHLAGGVPDTDDTAGAILALGSVPLPRGSAESSLLPGTACEQAASILPTDKNVCPPIGADGEVAHIGRTTYGDQIKAGVQWLLDLQNSDGGWPTFCRGWGKLPFDQSAPDLTAHALRALAAAHNSQSTRSQRAIRYGLDYLRRQQRADGSWIPLWFGNQQTPGQTNPVIGTSFVLRALEILDRDGPMAARGVDYLLAAQNLNGGWGGRHGIASSIEETALAVAALAGWKDNPAASEPAGDRLTESALGDGRPARRFSMRARRPPPVDHTCHSVPSAKATVQESLSRGLRYLIDRVAESDRPTPIGLYFSRLWYSERLYPLIWSIEALGRANSTDH
jgi:squalene-hopene/tetraprenyl-beta-curcumene cyclase